jgi:glycosyltransferase involved in cell wall biosynthesis
MKKPTLCMIHEGIGEYNAIAKVAKIGVEVALEAGWNVTCIAKRLDERLFDKVTWQKLHVPARVFLYKWLTARRCIRKALGDKSFDVIHAHQPQVADLSDIFQCHFLTRMSFERNCLDHRTGMRGAAMRAQERGVLWAEDFFYRRWNPQTRMLYDSELTRTDFHRLYGAQANEGVLVYPCPAGKFVSEDERKAARIKLVGGEQDRIVVGYLGGLHERKGYRRVADAVAADPRLFLLMGGQYSEGYVNEKLTGRYKTMGLVKDIHSFYAACDVFVVPSHYEPLGLVAFEAASRGVPVLATGEVGALPHLIEHGAGMEWNPAAPLGPLAMDAMARREEFCRGSAAMVEKLNLQSYAGQLLSEYARVIDRKRSMAQAAPARAMDSQIESNEPEESDWDASVKGIQ